MFDLQFRHGMPAHFAALANPTRLRIVQALAERGREEAPVTELARSLRMSQPRISWHLGLLRRGGVVKQRRDGRVVYCSLDLDNIRRYQNAFWTMLTEHRRRGVNV